MYLPSSYPKGLHRECLRYDLIQCKCCQTGEDLWACIMEGDSLTKNPFQTHFNALCKTKLLWREALSSASLLAHREILLVLKGHSEFSPTSLASPLPSNPFSELDMQLSELSCPFLLPCLLNESLALLFLSDCSEWWLYGPSSSVFIGRTVLQARLLIIIAF